MREVTGYVCSFCNKKVYQHKNSAHGHEKRCFKNPAVRACATCTHQIKGERQLPNKHYKPTWTCEIFQTDLGDWENLKMKCDNWAQKQEEDWEVIE